MTPLALTPAAAESLLAFWRDAGVDACFDDAPVDRTHVQPPPAVKAVARVTQRVSPALDVNGAAAEARRLAGEAETLEALAAAIAGFDGCPLSGLGARQSVFGRGRSDADLLIIGEAPSAEDDAEGRPFVGPAGRLLDRILGEAGLAERAFITTTVFWRPPGDRTPTPDEQAICLPLLERLLTLMKPRAVLLLGVTAARGVLATDEGIMKLRGTWNTWRLAEGAVSADALTTFHPGFLLKTPMAKKAVWADVLDLAVRLDGPRTSA